jgi:putative two-component system response regulator
MLTRNDSPGADEMATKNRKTWPMTVRTQNTILIVEDDLANVRLLHRLLAPSGHSIVTVFDGEAAIGSIACNRPDLVLLDVQLPGIDGFDVCRYIKQTPATRLTPVVLITGMDAREHRLAGIRAGADDFITKPIDAEQLQARVASLVRLKRYTDELESAEGVILSLALTVEARDAYTEGHCQRLAGYATALGKALGLGDDELAALHRGGYLHDVGKIAIPDAILQKPAKLTGAEYQVMKQHTIIGERLCGELRALALVAPIVRHHHERRDGTGYPDGLREDEIPSLAEIVAIVDTYDAITTTRPYRAARSLAVACEELRRDAANRVRDPELVALFVDLAVRGALDADRE